LKLREFLCQGTKINVEAVNVAWFTNDRDKDGFVGVENHNENRKINPFKCEKKNTIKITHG